MARDNYFARLQGGTTASADPFTGAMAGLNAGMTFKGFEFGLSIDLYSIKLGDDIQFLQIDQFDGRTIISSSIKKDYAPELGGTIEFNVGYDLLQLLRKPCRHHLIPFLGLGYGQRLYSSVDIIDITGMYKAELTSRSECGFDMSIGCRYEFDISSRVSLGAFYNISMLLHEKDFVGLSLKYSIPFP